MLHHIWVFMLLLMFVPKKHPIHLSVSDIEYNKKDKSLEVVIKVFIDDFEKILEKNYQTRLYLATPKENPATDKFVMDYLEKNFVLEIDGKVRKVEFHGKYSNESEDIFAIWVLAKVENVSQLKVVKLKNTLLMDLYDDQDNFVHVKYLGERKSMRFKGSNKVDEVDF